MGKDKRKKDGSRKQADPSLPIDVGSEPKAQRGPRNRASQEQNLKDCSKSADSSLRDKISDHSTSQSDSKPDPRNTTELFAKLKRETDDIKALKHQKPRRKIFSNWAKYEEPLPYLDHEVELQGADFEALVKAPLSGHFRFKSERTWDADVTSLSGELFSLDTDLLADGLATIPLCQKLDLPVSLFSEAELEDMDYCAKQCAVKYETTKRTSSRNQGRKEGLDATACNLLSALLIKEGNPVPPDEDTATKKTSLALSFDVAQAQVQSDILVTESVNTDEIINNNNNTNTDPDVKKISETGSIPDINEVTAAEKADFPKTSLCKVPRNEGQHHSIPAEEINHEPESWSRIIAAAVTPGTEVFHSSGAVTAEVRKQAIQQSDFEQTERFPQSVVPLDQRSSRRKSRGEARAAEVQKVEGQKSQRTDDLDFLLSLKGPVKEAQISSLRPSQVTKPTLEDDDEAVGPDSSQFPWVIPQKQTEDLEDWLDSVLDD
ncbi:hypothetical protein B7P43_G16230 [Cryptotermes secundus]|nr:uncharacterized protein LOC111863373 isoform X2 [Cryptotermes secundus]XP_023705599.1 uncharacterized protein LOC111863373 isoform X2 [Cryptotermes secundus]XP_023705681.1 uncharacterized protein LOC111863373 isoform X2 [Cryptotermes secundus]XP_023705766.1 uncharacterized protein LOC111863373 isoform X2 [Cryptotermes secundus]XP_023705846.1 uncharacterized protein LOC111863373 isoform X2 [Cryptotermes secundus]PNF44025.1 hypothetical protein B7P43_G16230 [Cryptotermes secundus]PNF44026.1 